jgi:hypothetical protein
MQWASIISLIISVAALLCAIRSAKIASKAYNLSLEQDRRHLPTLEIHLSDCYIKRDEHANARLFVFNLAITNKSASDNSVKEISLFIEYQRKEGPLSNISIPHNLGIENIGENLEPFTVPFRIDRFSIVSGLAVFKVPNELIHGSIVETYMVRVVDHKGHVSELETILLRELDSDKMEQSRNPH